jgi:hypothetical protein
MCAYHGCGVWPHATRDVCGRGVRSERMNKKNAHDGDEVDIPKQLGSVGCDQIGNERHVRELGSSKKDAWRSIREA